MIPRPVLSEQCDLPRPSPKLMPSDILPPTTQANIAPQAAGAVLDVALLAAAPAAMQSAYSASVDATAAAERGSLL